MLTELMVVLEFIRHNHMSFAEIPSADMASSRSSVKSGFEIDIKVIYVDHHLYYIA